MKKTKKLPGGVWSAAPTPLTAKMELDEDALARMVEHDRQLGINGYFLAGTNGEGPWMPDRQRRQLLKSLVRLNAGRVPVAMQTTDNSAARILDNMKMARDEGADIAVIAPPYFIANNNPAHVLEIYLEAIRKSPLPVGIYDRGAKGTVVVTDSMLKTICAEPRVVMIKDSSADMARMRIALAARKKRPQLNLLSGWEFNCVPYIKAGYDGLLLGGGVFNGFIAHQIIAAVNADDLPAAEKLQLRMNRLMHDVYGGKLNKCWLAGEKQLLVEMGILATSNNYPRYPLTASCRKAIKCAMKREKEFLKI